jgi:DNA-binding response OmpR family regulator
MRILVVEDDPVTLALLDSVLKLQGHELISSVNGEEAWLFLLDGGVQFVICDWSLPGLTGIELCKKIRDRHFHDYIYFILITGYQGQDKIKEAMDAGVDDFLSKPVDMTTLLVRLRVANRIQGFHRQIGALQELLPICMYCKKIRKDPVYWESVETFFNTRTGADFTHSLCPDCYQEKVKPQLDELKANMPKRE